MSAKLRRHWGLKVSRLPHVRDGTVPSVCLSLSLWLSSASAVHCVCLYVCVCGACLPHRHRGDI